MFVCRYRETNAGKFPTASEAKKQVGGGFYVIRKILQELEYQSKMSSMNTRHDMKLGKVVVKAHETSKKVVEVSVTRLSGINKDVKTEEVAEQRTSVSTAVNFDVSVF